jgi:hypothetical protein
MEELKAQEPVTRDRKSSGRWMDLFARRKTTSEKPSKRKDIEREESDRDKEGAAASTQQASSSASGAAGGAPSAVAAAAPSISPTKAKDVSGSAGGFTLKKIFGKKGENDGTTAVEEYTLTFTSLSADRSWLVLTTVWGAYK